ncbi:MAG: AraC family transcriptional regulator [Deltaproteobacteria bacterium]|nr:AraC family transcriptional regulator [Deltaproteobacteria bacterium]
MVTDAQHSIPAVHALHLVELVRRWEVSPEELLAPLGLRLEALADPGARMPVRVVEALVGQARRLTGEPGLGFFLGLQMRVSSHGYLGFAAMTSATVRDALEIAVRFAPTRTGALTLRLAVEGARAALVMEENADFGTARDVVVLSLLVGVWQIGRALTGHELAGSADVRGAEPPYFSRFRHVLPGVVRFGQPVHQLVFDAAVLDLPLNMADPAAQRLAREQCERELLALGAGAGITAAVRRALADPGGGGGTAGAGGTGGAGGFRGLDEVARALAMSPRTLKRRLSEAGASFSELLDEQRRDRALLLLRDGALTLDAIAERLGYSDVANFTRAFRRWTGKTPGALRRGTSG